MAFAGFGADLDTSGEHPIDAFSDDEGHDAAVEDEVEALQHLPPEERRKALR